MGVETQTEVVSDITRLRVSIARAAAATEAALIGEPEGSDADDPGSPVAAQKELWRQLAALRERVATAEGAHEDPGALRAELATLWCFAKTLEADADSWRATLRERIAELDRKRTAARRERQRSVAERENLMRRRDALQTRIVQTAARMAQRGGGEWRRTLPVFTVGEGLTVCSVSVACPRKGLRIAKYFLVTLDAARDDVTIRRE